MDSEMEALDLESQQLKMPQVQSQPLEARESENHHAEKRETAAPEVPAPIAWQDPEAEAPRSVEAEVHVDEGRDAEAYDIEEHALETLAQEALVEEEATQLGAIRELMAQARARGVWLSLGEIAEATEFGEASISAQLRHLRKAHHGGHHVEKRRRRRSLEGAVPTARDVRREPVIWEYRVLSPGAGRTLRSSGQAGPGAGRTGPGAGRTGLERRAAEEADAKACD